MKKSRDASELAARIVAAANKPAGASSVLSSVATPTRPTVAAAPETAQPVTRPDSNSPMEAGIMQRHLLFIYHFLSKSRLALPSLLIAINIGSAVNCFKGKDWKHGVYYVSSALCLLMVAVMGES